MPCLRLVTIVWLHWSVIEIYKLECFIAVWFGFLVILCHISHHWLIYTLKEYQKGQGFCSDGLGNSCRNFSFSVKCCMGLRFTCILPLILFVVFHPFNSPSLFVFLLIFLCQRKMRPESKTFCFRDSEFDVSVQ